MTRRTALLISAALIGGCQTVADNTRVLTVNDVAERLAEFDGQTIRIRGWLDRCRGIECILRGRDHATLSIAAGPYDRQLNQDAPADVVLLARVDASCHSGKLICLDRTPDLRVLRVERVHGATPRNQSRNL